MAMPVSEEGGQMKVRPELMENGRLYHCVIGDRLMLVYRDEQEVMHCYEVEDASLVAAVRSCSTHEEAAGLLERLGEGGMNRVINQQDGGGVTMSADSDAAKIYNEYKSSSESAGSADDAPQHAPDAHHGGSHEGSGSESCGCHGDGGTCEDKESGAPDVNASDIQATPGQDSAASEGSGEGAKEGEQRDRSVVLIGIKPIMTYVTATLTQLATLPKITIKARGKRITQAVDVSQMIVKRMNTVGYKISDVRIASDSFTGEDGRNRKISTMEIDIVKSS